MDALPVSFSHRASEPDVRPQHWLKDSAAQAAAAPAAGAAAASAAAAAEAAAAAAAAAEAEAEAATKDDTARCEAFFFKEAELVLQQLHTLADLTQQAAALALEDASIEKTESAAAAAAEATTAAARPATSSPVTASCSSQQGNGSAAPAAAAAAAAAAAKAAEGEQLTVFSVDVWLRRFCSIAAEVVYTLERYQEQPQLLDPYLPQQLEVLVQPVRRHLLLLAQEQQQLKRIRCKWAAAVSCCCLRMLLHLVYVHCKVRGTKAIRSLLPQEPELLEQVLAAAAALQQQQQQQQQQYQEQEEEQQQPQSNDNSCAGAAQDAKATAAAAAARAEAAAAAVCRDSAPLWSSIFTLFAWLSLLVLAPFSLLSLDSNSNTNQQQQQQQPLEQNQQQQQQEEQQQQREEEQQLKLA